MAERRQAGAESIALNSGWVSEITPKKPLLHLPLRKIWRYRDLLHLRSGAISFPCTSRPSLGRCGTLCSPLSAQWFTKSSSGTLRPSDEQHPAVPFLHVGNCHLVLFFRLSEQNVQYVLCQLRAFHQSL